MSSTTPSIVCRRPRVGERFRVHPGGERRAATLVAYDRGTGEAYLVAQSLWQDGSGLAPVYLRACENDHGERFIWCVAIRPAFTDGSPQPELLLADTAERRWCSPRPACGSFEMLAPGAIPEPAWEGFDFIDAVDQAFRGRIITSSNHPLLAANREGQ